jgi:hypothetical protein
VKTALPCGTVMAIVVLVVVPAAAVLVLYPDRTGSGSTTSTTTDSHVVTSDPLTYFPKGRESAQVSFSRIHNGDVLTVGTTPIWH